MRDLRDDGSVPLSRGRSRQSPRFVIDEEKMIVRAIDVIQPEIDDCGSRCAVILRRRRRQPAVGKCIIDLAVDDVRIEFAVRQTDAVVLVGRRD